ncbi:MAG: sensor histidine kinase [Thermoguttaceae bacterium]
MRIGLKLTAAFLSIASLVGATGYLARTSSRQVEQHMDRLSRSAVVKVAGTMEITRALYAGQLAAYACLQAAQTQSGNVFSEQRGALEDQQARALEGLARQNQVAESMIRWAEHQGLEEVAEQERSQTLQNLGQLRQEFDRYSSLQDDFLEIVERDPAIAELFLQDQLCGHFENRLLPLLTAYRHRAEQELTQAVRAAERAMVVAEQQRGLLILAAASALVMGLLTSRAIGRPLTELQRAALEIGRGRFDIRVTPRSHDELGSLADSVNQMAANLQETTVSRAYLDNIIQSMREMLVVVDSGMKIRDVNRAACAELGYEGAGLQGKHLRELFVDEQFDGEGPLPGLLAAGLECSMRDKAGAAIPVLCSAAALSDAEGSLAGYVCVASNISRQKLAEAQLLASLHEKELLLNEVHHRVKNNLQVISSLLSLQARQIEDPATARLFEESQGRIQSMALIHEQLYRSGDLARIDFAAYVEDLVSHLRRGLGSDGSRVDFGLRIEPLPLSLDMAIPCGMIVNELVCNSLKHAFPQGEPGQVRIAFARDAGGYCLTVADNGVGIENGPVDENRRSVGLKVVHALVRQIRGGLEVGQERGTVFTIRFQ